MRIALPSGGEATVSADVQAETVEALDEMTQAAILAIAERPRVKACADLLCQHSRRQHLKKHFDPAVRGKLSCYEYAVCNVSGCRCAGYVPRTV